MNLRADLKASLRPNVDLSRYCTMQVGGKADLFAEPQREEELVELIEYARQEKMKYMVLGKGSNILFPDAGYRGLIISLMHYEQDKLEFDADHAVVNASAGIYLYRLVLACRDAGLAGLEFLANVPGTLGGAVVMNAGFSRFPGQRNEIGDLVREVTVLSENGEKTVLFRPHLEFAYRSSNLQGRIVLGVSLKLWRRKPEEIEKEIRSNFEYRNQIQDMRYPSSGSIFKNPPDSEKTAGQWIESAGLKGTRVGAAMISEKHGNYIVNTGGAKSSDIVQLIRNVQKAVLDATGILLEPEVRIVE